MLTPEQLEQLRADLVKVENELANRYGFKPGVRITLVVRHPHREPAIENVVVSNDDLGAAAAAILDERRAIDARVNPNRTTPRRAKLGSG